MAKFNEILSGIAKDFVQLQVASDMASIETFNRYQNSTEKSEENLKFLDIPRFTVSDVKLNLKFAIAEVTSEKAYSKEVIERTNEKWKSIVEEQILPDIIRSSRRLTAADKKKIELDIKKSNSFLKKSKPKINNIISDGKNNTLNNTTSFVFSYLEQLPDDISAKIKNDTALKNTVNRLVTATFNKEFAVLQKEADTESVVERDFEIIINKDELEKIDNSQVHEISFNLTPDFIKLVKDDNVK